MKKILVSTTALVSILASAAFADTDNKIDVKVNGLVNVEYGMRNQKAPYKKSVPEQGLNQNLTTNQKNSMFYNSARVSVSANAKSDSGFAYGGVLGVKTTGQQRTGKDSSTTDNTYVFVESSLGRIELGSNYSASKTMGITGSTVARGTGGVSGDFDNFITWDYVDQNNNVAAFTEDSDSTDTITKTSKAFITSSSLLGDSYRADKISENTNKLTYYTPQVAGFQLGLSYTPDSDALGNQTSFINNVSSGSRTVKDLYHVGLKYSNNFDQIGLGLSAIGVSGSVNKKADNDTTKHNLSGYSFGGVLSYSAFSASASWGSINKKFFTVDGAADGTAQNSAIAKAPKFWSTGLAYVQGPFGVSATYYNSKNYDGNKFTAYGLSADYNFAPGLTTYAEYVNFNAKPNKTLASNAGVTNNKGNVYLVGTQLSF